MSSDFGLFSTSYLPTLEYLLKLNEYDHVVINEHDLWQRQSLRNRAFILSPNGVQKLSVPIIHPKEKINFIKDIKISYDLPWIRMHKGALEAAYNTSAFFDYFKDELWSIYDLKPVFLLDLNHSILELMIKKFKIKTIITRSKNPEITSQSNFSVLSNANNNLPVLINEDRFIDYPQVFSYKFPFAKNLSAIDKLSNIGYL